MNTLSQRLKEAREQAGLSQAALADRLRTTQQAIQQAETGKSKRPRYLLEAAKALGVSVEWLMYGDLVRSTEGFQDYRNTNVKEAPRSSQEGMRMLNVHESKLGGPNGGAIILPDVCDTVPCLPQLTAVQKAYAVYMYDHSMAPRFRASDVLYVQPGVPVKAGDDVVIKLDIGSGDLYELLVVSLRDVTAQNVLFVSYSDSQKRISLSRNFVTSVDKIVGSTSF